MALDDELRAYIAKEIVRNESVELSEDSQLIQGGLINSIGIMKLIAFLNERFGVQFEDEDYKLENFETLGTIRSLIERRSPATAP